MTPEPNKHRRVRECLGEWRKRCILHSIFGGNMRAVAPMDVVNRCPSVRVVLDAAADVVKADRSSKDASAVRRTSVRSE
jgi:hypothetical protein